MNVLYATYIRYHAFRWKTFRKRTHTSMYGSIVVAEACGMLSGLKLSTHPFSQFCRGKTSNEFSFR